MSTKLTEIRHYRVGRHKLVTPHLESYCLQLFSGFLLDLRQATTRRRWRTPGAWVWMSQWGWLTCQRLWELFSQNEKNLWRSDRFRKNLDRTFGEKNIPFHSICSTFSYPVFMYYVHPPIWNLLHHRIAWHWVIFRLLILILSHSTFGIKLLWDWPRQDWRKSELLYFWCSQQLSLNSQWLVHCLFKNFTFKLWFSKIALRGKKYLTVRNQQRKQLLIFQSISPFMYRFESFYINRVYVRV